ncbi:polysaccharide pyruvyl transferase family protein [Candidatus Woesearchaeota archaeon]|nr:polysaccharide pyruvyl transferase family protein [Candidatus Woesearchaeota archaeon]
MYAYWWTGAKNFGDLLNPLLIKKISGTTPINLYPIKDTIDSNKIKEINLVIGSILQQDYSNFEKKVNIWGTGFIHNKWNPFLKPKKVCAVRGPLTRKILLNSGINCPEIYGDPALLYPNYYKPKLKKKYKLGIVAHWSEKNSNLLENFKDKEDVLIIDVQKRIKKIINQICKCELIASSSLHGLIISDAYKIPSTWVFFERKTQPYFKYLDYFLSVGRKDKKPLLIEKRTKLSDIYKRFYDYEIEIDLDKLYDACPFKK